MEALIGPSECFTSLVRRSYEYYSILSINTAEINLFEGQADVGAKV